MMSVLNASVAAESRSGVAEKSSPTMRLARLLASTLLPSAAASTPGGSTPMPTASTCDCASEGMGPAMGLDREASLICDAMSYAAASSWTAMTAVGAGAVPDGAPTFATVEPVVIGPVTSDALPDCAVAGAAAA